MIGDWVHIDESSCKIQSLTKLNEYSALGEYAYLYIGHTKYVKGIPLTPEILEKNGFKFIKDSEFSISSEKLLSDNTYIYIRLHKVEGWSIHISYRGMEDFELNIHLRHVHTLQHAFRLCGLNELADNFKI